MDFKDLIKNAKAEIDQQGIKLIEGVVYDAVIRNASLTVNDKDKEVIQLQVKLTTPEVEGKVISKQYFIDESYSENARKIAIMQVMGILKDLSKLTWDESDDAQSLTLKLMSLKDKPVFIKLKKVADKKDPSKVYNNYDILTRKPQA